MITREFEAHLRRIQGVDTRIGVQVTLVYDPEDDPYAVKAIFCTGEPDDQVWHFGWELLRAGAYSSVPLGQGDVKFQYSQDEGAVIMCLQGSDPHGASAHADLTLPIDEVTEFLQDTSAPFAESAGNSEAAVDEFLKELFEA